MLYKFKQKKTSKYPCTIFLIVATRGQRQRCWLRYGTRMTVGRHTKVALLQLLLALNGRQRNGCARIGGVANLIDGRQTGKVTLVDFVDVVLGVVFVVVVVLGHVGRIHIGTVLGQSRHIGQCVLVRIRLMVMDAAAGRTRVVVFFRLVSLARLLLMVVVIAERRLVSVVALRRAALGWSAAMLIVIWSCAVGWDAIHAIRHDNCIMCRDNMRVSSAHTCSPKLKYWSAPALPSRLPMVSAGSMAFSALNVFIESTRLSKVR